MDLIALLNTTEIHSLIGLAIIFGTLAFGAVLGYYARQSIAKKQVGTLEERIQKRISQAKEEAEKIIKQMEEGFTKPKPKYQFEEGDEVRVIDGPFSNFQGIVEEVKPDKEKLRVLISIFGRSTPVELDFIQVNKM